MTTRGLNKRTTRYLVQMRKTNGAPYGLTITAYDEQEAEITARRIAGYRDHDVISVVRVA